MAMQQTVTLNLTLVGDGVATTFTNNLTKLFGAQTDSPIINGSIVPTAANVLSVSPGLPTGTASVDGSGNLTITFNSAWPSGSQGTVQVQILFNGVTGVGAPGITQVDGEKTTYRAISGLLFTVASSPTDVFIMSGSSTKTVRVTKIYIQGYNASSSGFYNMQLIRRSATDTGGTPVPITPAKLDTNDPNSTIATCQYYTAAPSALGAQVAIVDQQRILMPTSPTTFSPPQELNFGQLPGGKSVVLRGTGDFMAINLSGLPVSGTNTLSIIVQYTEE